MLYNHIFVRYLDTNLSNVELLEPIRRQEPKICKLSLRSEDKLLYWPNVDRLAIMLGNILRR